MTHTINEDLLEDFITFCGPYIETHDVDPLYPLLRRVMIDMGIVGDEEVHFLLWYMAWYDIGSAMQAWIDLSGFTANITIQQAKYWCKNERRGHRNGINLIKHWKAMLAGVQGYGGWRKWAQAGWQSTSTPFHQFSNWCITDDHVQLIWGNGRWAGYKACELLQKVCDLNCQAPDMGHANSSGPRKAMALLYPDAPFHEDQSSKAIGTLNEMSMDLQDRVKGVIQNASDMATLETCACGFYSLWKGDYYIGCDIDLNLETTMRTQGRVRELLLAARRMVFQPQYLGELNGWAGEDKTRLRLYRDQHIIAVR